MCDASSDPTTYDHPSDHETRISEASAAVAAIPKRPRVMHVSGERPLGRVTDVSESERGITVTVQPRDAETARFILDYAIDLDPRVEVTPWPAFPEMAASDYPDEPRTPSRWERLRAAFPRWTW